MAIFNREPLEAKVRLYAKPIKNFANINQFDYATEWFIRNGEENILYFQLVDQDQDGLRYIPTDASYSVNVTFPSLDDAGIITKVASQANALDRSIWSVSLLDTDKVFSGNVKISLTEGGVTKNLVLFDGLSVENPDEVGGC